VAQVNGQGHHAKKSHDGERGNDGHHSGFVGHKPPEAIFAGT
jgi:hypothetical protein